MIGEAWHERDPVEFARTRAELEAEFPYLFVTVNDGRTVLRGELPIVVDGRVVDVFEIEVMVPPAGPRSEIPIVREIRGRIPRHRDRHVDERTGNACLCVNDEYWFKHPHGMDLVEFLRGPVTSYFIAQLSYELGNGWPFGERGHGADGIVEFYMPILGASDLPTVRRYLKVISAKKVRPHWLCPCGSGKRVWMCHGALIQRLRARIPRSAASHSLEILNGT